jgi:signal transduction histidine kinase
MFRYLQRPLEPGLIKMLRYFSGVAFIYFCLLWAYGFLTMGRNFSLEVQAWINLIANAGLFAYLSLPVLERKLKRYYLPIGLAAYTLASMTSSLMYLLESSPDRYLYIARSWSLMPVQIVVLVVLAWQYGFRPALIYTVFTTALEISVSLLVFKRINLEILPILGLPVVRAFAFGSVANIISSLMQAQRAQKRQLLQANLQLGQMNATLERLAVSRERNRLARELHDTLAHTLSGTAVNLEAMKTLVPPADEQLQTMLNDSLSAVRNGLGETRRALADLRSQPLDDLGLEEALRAAMRNLAERTGVNIEVEIRLGQVTLPPLVEQTYYRVTQEAAENIFRHAEASLASLNLAWEGRKLRLVLKDDGRGFDPHEKAALHQFGLRGLRERATAIAAELEIQSQPGEGTEIVLEWEQADETPLDL